MHAAQLKKGLNEKKENVGKENFLEMIDRVPSSSKNQHISLT
jgi:hypothetical protein